jgi:hypothetical protein
MEESRMHAVTITVDNNSVCVDPYYRELVKAKKEKVKWEIVPKGTEFKVSFDKSPFQKREFNEGDNQSGDIKEDAAGQGEIYEYIVEIPSLKAKMDPGIIIR